MKAPERSQTHPVVEEYGRLASQYDAKWSFYVEATTRETLARLTLRPGERLLDVGCGTGALLHRLSRSPGVQLTGVDPVPEMLALARRRLPPEVELRAGWAEELPFDREQFDVVVSCNAFHYFRKPVAAFLTARKVIPVAARMISDAVEVIPDAVRIILAAAKVIPIAAEVVPDTSGIIRIAAETIRTARKVIPVATEAIWGASGIIRIAAETIRTASKVIPVTTGMIPVVAEVIPDAIRIILAAAKAIPTAIGAFSRRRLQAAPRFQASGSAGGL